MSHEDRVRRAFERIRVKPPFSVGFERGTYVPDRSRVEEVVFRLRQILTDEEIAALDDEALDRRVTQVWELVRWLHTGDEATQREAS